MSYQFTKKLKSDFETAIIKVTEALNSEGFVILKSFDLKESLKSKMNVDFRQYKVLGACNPHFEHQALIAENSIGTMLPCDVIVQEQEPGSIEISTVDTVASSMTFQNEKLGKIAKAVRRKLKNVISNL